ncbi:hypothetical protein A5746_21270 [Mycolicibacterium conceptionense]|uniref:hypothetical protein n=1 Tax=Mycolicibacterium conceptionense TaxID=451644 RepID=UPI0007EC3246|nr:hypothetical protein [Mycolicibacterium conceptionense]OBK04584.1 hypothetical protein A5639_20060 [Mycolicibacterium conceptionense]OMB88313.1 hypothetical protein A5741_15135 [Mycolicibacterium conceptionense]OMB90232.1 hypothetical protein A5746_21270 [Mycolicibacterium conceptionense]
MSGFGNYLGATMGTSTNEEGRSGAVYDNSFVTNPNYPKRADLVTDDGDFEEIPEKWAEKDTVVDYKPNSALLGEVPGLISDNSTYLEVQDKLNGPDKLNWEDKEFVFMRKEKDSLNLDAIAALAKNWRDRGTDLKKNSEEFKESVDKEITGKWSGESAAAAEAASQQVTKSAIYDFSPAAEAVAKRLDELHSAFAQIHRDFPDKYDNNDLLDDGKFNAKELDDAIESYNNRYEVDGSGHLRKRDGGGYVTAADALKELEELNRSIEAYRTAVQLFQHVYNPVVEAVTQNFPHLPTPPNMKYGDPTGPGGPGGPGGDPAGPGGPGGTSPFKPGDPGAGTSPFDKSAFDKLNANKPTDLEKFKPIDQKPIDQEDLTTDPTKDALDNLTDPVKSAMDTATNAAKDAIGQAMDAAKNAAGQNPLGSGTGGPPEGVLGLGPQGLGGAAAAGKGAGGAGGGVPLRGLPSGLPSSAPATAAAKMPATGAGAGAGLGAGAGSPGAGAPAAGQRAGDQNGKGHQVNKALRRKKNGKDVIGDSDASVPVVGADEEAEQQEKSPADKSETRRRIPQRGTTWQPDSAVQPGPARPARGQQFTPGRSE